MKRNVIWLIDKMFLYTLPRNRNLTYMKKFYFSMLSLFVIPALVFAQAQQDYSTNARLNDRISTLIKTYPQWIQSKEIVKTLGGKTIWMLTIGTGATDQKQGIAVVGGVDGRHLLGVELAIGFAEKICVLTNTDKIKALLATHTFYVFPNMSPDATEQYFAKLKYARSGNATITDDDRDGKTNEDGFDDLNGDGKISWMRVLDPTGKYIVNPEDSRSMILADASKGETGKYLLLSEGKDNDKDGEFNEDGEGGVAFNRNMSYNYQNFVPGAGEYAVSEKESRAMLDLLFDKFNIYSMVTFGPVNNLSTPVQSSPAGLAKRIITSWSSADAAANALVSTKYNKIIGAKDAPKTKAENGDFSEWAYFHFGRFSYSTPGWWVPTVKADTAKKQKALTRNDEAAAYLRWADAESISSTFANWTQVTHPDFPGQTVEVGGIDPFVLNNPPYKMVDGIVKKHTDFLVELADMGPKLEIVGLKTEKVGEGLTRITAKVFNAGSLPTLTSVGERSYFLQKIVVSVKLATSQTILSGTKANLLNSIPGQGYETLTWLVKGSGKMTISAGSLSTGTTSIDVTL